MINMAGVCLVSAATFMEHWKRRQMRLNYRWDLTSFEEEQVSERERNSPCSQGVYFKHLPLVINDSLFGAVRGVTRILKDLGYS